MDTRHIQEISSRLDSLENTYREALNSAEVGIWEWNIETGELFWDSNMRVLYEAHKEELKGTYEDFASRVHPEDLKYVEKQIQECIELDVPYIYFFRIKSKNNPHGWKYVKGRGKIIRDKWGKAIRMVGVNLESDCPEEYLTHWREHAMNRALEQKATDYHNLVANYKGA